jgi:DNA-binding MarR family transcriptional regulator
MSRDSYKRPDPAASTADWIESLPPGKERLLGELIDEVRGNQNAVDQMDQAVAEVMGINRTDNRCLDIIDRRGPITAGQLAREAGLTTGAVTALLDRLEAKGLVRRLRDPGDRRRVLVELTDKARELGLELYGPLKDMGWRFTGGLSEDDLRLLIEFNRVSREINERRAAEIRERYGGGAKARPGPASAASPAPPASGSASPEPRRPRR